VGVETIGIQIKEDTMTELPVNAEIEYHKWLKDDAIKVKLMKMSKGYQWELTYEGEKVEDVIARLQEADTKLREVWGEKEQ